MGDASVGLAEGILYDSTCVAVSSREVDGMISRGDGTDRELSRRSGFLEVRVGASGLAVELLALPGLDVLRECNLSPRHFVGLVESRFCVGARVQLELSIEGPRRVIVEARWSVRSRLAEACFGRPERP